MAAPFEPRKLFRAKIEKQIFDLHALSASIGMVNDKTLSLVGRDVQQAAKRGIGQTAPAVTKAGRMAVVAAAAAVASPAATPSAASVPRRVPRNW